MLRSILSPLAGRAYSAVLIKNSPLGHSFFQSQLISDFDQLEKFMDQIAAGCDRPVLAGIFLLKSAKNAAFINRCVPGVNIPEHIINRLAAAADPLQEGIKIAAEQVQAARQLLPGRPYDGRQARRFDSADFTNGGYRTPDPSLLGRPA